MPQKDSKLEAADQREHLPLPLKDYTSISYKKGSRNRPVAVE
jgi:hypothetical protein